MNVCKLYKCYISIIDVFEGINVNEKSVSKDCDICHD